MGHRVFLLSLALFLLIASTTRHAQAAAVTQGMGAAAVGSNSMMRSMVGSRPPSCAGRCWWCGGRRCVAVQVPITPQGNRVHAIGGRRPTRGGASSSAALQQQQQQHHHQQEVSSYDDHSNYKPLSWRCKCGGGA